jgi:hypothetical protein
VAAPGSLDARYERLAGAAQRRRELYLARTLLGFTIDEWLALPWWQRRLYVEEGNAEAQRQEEAAEATGGESGGPMDPAAAILGGSMGQLSDLGFGTG